MAQTRNASQGILADDKTQERERIIEMLKKAYWMADALKDKKVAILVANEGIEQVELTEPRKALEDAGATVELLAPEPLVTSRQPDDLPAFNAKMVEELAEGRHEGDKPSERFAKDGAKA